MTDNINIETEQALLGACLLNPEAIDLVDGIVRAEDFSEPIHVMLFDALLKTRAEGRRIDVRLITSILGQEAHAVLVAGMRTSEYIAALAAGATTVINAPDYARILVESANYRRLAEAGKILAGRAAQGHGAGTPAQVASSIITDLDAVITSSASKGARRVSVAQAVASAHEVYVERTEHGVDHGISWGLVDLDQVSKLYPGELTIAAARPSMGKTTLALSTCLAAAKAGHGVLFVSLEMGEVSLGQRVIADIAFDPDLDPIAYTDIRDGRVPEAAKSRISLAIDKVRNYPMVIEQEPGLTVSQIAARARSSKQYLKRTFNADLDLLVVDHLGLIASGDRYAGARHLELGAITSSLKVLAKEMQIPVLLLCQLSRGVEGRENKRPMLSDLRESGRIEEDADTVILLYREAYYLERTKETDPDKDMVRVDRLREARNTLEINVAKQRQGATKSVDAYVCMPANAIRNMARRYL